MTSNHWRSVGIYVALVAVVVVSLVVYQVRTNAKLRRIDRVSCQNRLLILRYHALHADGQVDMATGRLWSTEFRDQLQRTMRRCA